jgi:hypothetical protein
MHQFIAGVLAGAGSLVGLRILFQEGLKKRIGNLRWAAFIDYRKSRKSGL